MAKRVKRMNRNFLFLVEGQSEKFGKELQKYTGRGYLAIVVFKPK